MSWNHRVFWVLKSHLMLTPCPGQGHLLDQIAGYVTDKKPRAIFSRVCGFCKVSAQVASPFVWGESPRSGGVPPLPVLAGAAAAEGCRAGESIERAASSQGCFFLFFFFGLVLAWTTHFSSFTFTPIFLFPGMLCSSDCPKVAKPLWSSICSWGTVVCSKLDCFCWSYLTNNSIVIKSSKLYL